MHLRGTNRCWATCCVSARVSQTMRDTSRAVIAQSSIRVQVLASQSFICMYMYWAEGPCIGPLASSSIGEIMGGSYVLARPIQRLGLSVALISACLLFHDEVFAAQAPQNEITPGSVVEKVVVSSEPDQSYAIYLPSNYSTKQKWPTIFCFDPGARGKFALDHFRAAAEKLGYVIACSNNSRNGLDAEVVTKIVTAFWRDVHDRFSI